MIRISDFQFRWQHLQNHKLFLACSGGVDSMVLLHLLQSVSADVNVLHLNYQLRGEDSDLDEKLVREICEKNKIPLQVKYVQTKKILVTRGGNLQDLARKKRYGWFKEILAENESGRIVLGHHQDDQVETFFQHIARKSGIIGMAGMLEDHAGIIRPLLHYGKEEIYAFARENGIKWREDLSNEGNSYTRNKLRNVIIPELENEISGLKESVLILVKAFQETQKELEQKVSKLVEQIRETENWLLADFDACTEEERVEVLRSVGIRQTFISELQKIRSSQKGKKLFVDEFVITRETDSICFSRQKPEPKYQLCVEQVDRLPEFFDKNVIYLDSAKIKGDLRLRKWQIGDRMKLVGMHGSKLISNVLSAEKIPSHEKENALVLVDDEKILWCVGVRVSSLAVASGDTVEIFRVGLRVV